MTSRLTAERQFARLRFAKLASIEIVFFLVQTGNIRFNVYVTNYLLLLTGRMAKKKKKNQQQPIFNEWLLSKRVCKVGRISQETFS